MSDENPALSIVAKAMNCHQILDRKHFTQQILLTSSQIPDALKDEYRSDIHCILNASSEDKLYSLLQHAHIKYPQMKAQDFLLKIERNKHKVCWAYTSNFFTMGHVSDQRAESTNASVKGKGTMKKFLSKCTLPQTVNRLEAVSREWDQKQKASNELTTLRQSQVLWLQPLTTLIQEQGTCNQLSPGSTKFLIKTRTRIPLRNSLWI